MNIFNNILKLSSTQNTGLKIIKNVHSSSYLEAISPLSYRLDLKKCRSKSLPCQNRIDAPVPSTTVLQSQNKFCGKKTAVTFKVGHRHRQFSTFFDRLKFWKTTQASGNDNKVVTKRAKDPSTGHLCDNCRKEVPPDTQARKEFSNIVTQVSEGLAASKTTTSLLQVGSSLKPEENRGHHEARTAIKQTPKEAKGKRNENSSIFAIKKNYQICRTCGGHHGQRKQISEMNKFALESKNIALNAKRNFEKEKTKATNNVRWKVKSANFDPYKYGELIPNEMTRSSNTKKSPSQSDVNALKKVEPKASVGSAVEVDESFVILSKKQLDEEAASVSVRPSTVTQSQNRSSRMILKLCPDNNFYEIKSTETLPPKTATSKTRIVHLRKFPFHCDNSCKHLPHVDHTKPTLDVTWKKPNKAQRKFHTDLSPRHLCETGMKEKGPEDPKLERSLSGKQLVFRQLGIEKTMEEYKKCKNVVEGGKIIAKGLRTIWTNIKRQNLR